MQALRPYRAEQEQLHTAQTSQQIEQQLPGGPIGPLQIIHDQNKYPAVGHRAQPAG